MAGEPAGMRTTEFVAVKLLFAGLALVVGFLLFGVFGRIACSGYSSRSRLRRSSTSCPSSG